MFNKILLILSLNCFINSLNASDVFVSTDFSNGKGILRDSGSQCFVYTPKHVVEDSDEIYISSATVRNAEASLLTTYPVDLAILQLPNDQDNMCRHKSWIDGGERVSAILNSTNEATLSFRKKNGALTEYQINIVEKELHTFFYIELANKKRSIIQGMSGSIILVGQYPIGMLLAVENGVGKVLRIDAINDISKSLIQSFASKTELQAQKSTDLAAYPSESVSTPINAPLNSSGTFNGHVAQGGKKEFQIIASGNTAYRITSKKQSDNVRAYIEFLSPSGKRLLGDYFDTSKGNYTWGVGTVDEGEHKLRVSGNSGGGNFHLQIDQMASPEQLVGQANVLESGDVAKGYIAQHTYAEYKLLATGNSAYRITSKKQSDNVRAYIEFLSPSGKRLLGDYF
ncbi:hypothetical protein, partial [Vibrio sp. PNB22_1_1]